MKVELNEREDTIEVGDIVSYRHEYNSVLCMVVFDRFEEHFPYRVLCLEDGMVLDGFRSIEQFNKRDGVKLVAKRNDVVLRGV